MYILSEDYYVLDKKATHFIITNADYDNKNIICDVYGENGLLAEGRIFYYEGNYKMLPNGNVI